MRRDNPSIPVLSICFGSEASMFQNPKVAVAMAVMAVVGAIIIIVTTVLSM